MTGISHSTLIEAMSVYYRILFLDNSNKVLIDSDNMVRWMSYVNGKEVPKAAAVALLASIDTM
jgi:hypothetical protein